MRIEEDLVAAARIVSRSSRILVVGCSGGGKSTLSRDLSVLLGSPHISMDKAFFWLPEWQPRPRDEQRRMIAATVATDRWIMDGSNPSSFDLRLPRTDVVLWVRLPRLLCLWGAVKRAVRHHGQARPDMAEGCLEKFPDREFLSYIWNFEKVQAPTMIRNFDLYGPDVPVVILKSHAQIGKLLDLVKSRD